MVSNVLLEGRVQSVVGHDPERYVGREQHYVVVLGLQEGDQAVQHLDISSDQGAPAEKIFVLLDDIDDPRPQLLVDVDAHSWGV